jgi:hypothetical protein
MRLNKLIRKMRPYLSLSLICVGAGGLVGGWAGTAHAQVPATWTGAAGDNLYSYPNNWSTNPFYPTNGNPAGTTCWKRWVDRLSRRARRLPGPWKKGSQYRLGA